MTEASDPKSETPALTINQTGQQKPPQDVLFNSNKGKKARNYSFSHRDPDTLGTARIGGDDNPDPNTPSFSIPAHIGSVFWAILKICYENANEKVYADDLIKKVDELQRDRDEAAWNSYIKKEQTTVYRRGEGKRLVQKIKPWQERVINNAKTLTRKGGDNAYGKRLIERGHILRYETDAKMKPYFILNTSIDASKAEAKNG